MRDTDADWREIGAQFPYWGVLTAPEYRRDDLGPELLDTFYATGRAHMADVVRRLEALSGAPFRAACALDFGCGVGRLTEAMTAYADEVVGVDISPGMLAQAKANGAGAALYVDTPPAGPVDWINSFIVFQHIPPERGLQLLDQLMNRLAPGGFVSLHVTTGREAGLGPTPAPLRPPRTPVGWTFRRLRPPPEPPVGQMLMYDYDLGRVIDILHGAGIGEIHLALTNHGGHLGEMIFGRRGG